MFSSVLTLTSLYSRHLPVTAEPGIDISNISATMTTLIPAAFISTALFLCQCEIPFEFQMEHKQAIIWVQRIVFFSTQVWQSFYVLRLFYQPPMKASVFFFFFFVFSLSRKWSDGPPTAKGKCLFPCKAFVAFIALAVTFSKSISVTTETLELILQTG